MSSNSLNITIKTRYDLLKNALSAVGTGCLLTVSLSANASTLISSTEYLDYQLPNSVQQQCVEKSNCPEIDVKYLKSNHDWINAITNKRINNIVINSKLTESQPTTKHDAKSAKAALDDFAKSQFIDMPANTSWAYALMVKPEYLGHVELGRTEDFELFEINAYVFTGGAHGMPFSEYLVFDSNSKKQVTLTDMLQVGKKSRFKALAYEAYKTWVSTVDTDVNNYEKNWPFTLRDNITLTDKGIDIRYQHYAIGPYAYGMPVLSIPYTKLSGIIKPHFLPNNRSVKH